MLTFRSRCAYENIEDLVRVNIGVECREAGDRREKAVAEKDGGTKCVHYEREATVRSMRDSESVRSFILSIRSG